MYVHVKDKPSLLVSIVTKQRLVWLITAARGLGPGPASHRYTFQQSPRIDGAGVITNVGVITSVHCIDGVGVITSVL